MEVIDGQTESEPPPRQTEPDGVSGLRPRRPIVVRGRLEPLSNIPFHTNGPLTRWLMASKAMDPELGHFIAIHQFTEVAPARREYCHPHAHDCDEINIYHTTSALEVELRFGEETLLIEAPATVFIPAGVYHAANVRSGSGFLVVVLCDGEYRAAGLSAAPPPE